MTPLFDADISAAAPRAAAQPRPFSHADLPDLHEAPKRRLHPMIAGAFGFMAAAGAFYGAEAVAPAVAKPSTIIGGYAHEIAAAQKSGELKAQLRYDTAFRNMDLSYQDQIKGIETAAVQWQEKTRTVLGAYADDYRAAWQRANIFGQATADIQKAYASQRYQVAHETLGGEVTGANTATIVGLLGGLFDPEFGQSALNFADQVRTRALDKLDEAARGGVTVSVEGWDKDLPDPDTVKDHIVNLPALELPRFRSRPIPTAPDTNR